MMLGAKVKLKKIVAETFKNLYNRLRQILRKANLIKDFLTIKGVSLKNMLK